MAIGEIGIKVFAASLTLGISAIATAIVEAKIGTSAVAVMAENENFFGKGLLMTVIPETLVIFGFALALLILYL